MRLRDFLAPERTVVPLVARTLPDAARELLEPLAAAHGVLDAGKLRRLVTDLNRDDVIAMGDRAYLLHHRTDAVGRLLVAVGVAPEPIEHQIGDDAPRSARVVLLVATPPRHAARYLQVVGAFARLLRKPDELSAFHDARTPEALMELDSLSASKLPEQLAVRDVMTEKPRTISADATLKEAARTLVRTGLGALPVVDDDRRVLGMVSEREVIRHLLTIQAFTGPDARAASPPSAGTVRSVREAMTRQVLCVSPDQPLAEVASLMSNKDVDRVPVVRDGLLVGFLTRGDIVRKLIGS